MQLELNNISSRIVDLERQRSITRSAAQSVSVNAEIEVSDSDNPAQPPTSYQAIPINHRAPSNALESADASIQSASEDALIEQSEIE